MEIILKRIAPEMIILYGSYATGKYVEDIYQEDGITYEYRSDFDILIIVENEHSIPKGFHHNVIREADKSEKCETPISIIYHSAKYVNKELESGNFFFVEITKKQGKVLYDTKKYTLAEPKQLSPKEQQQKAQLYFDQWFEIANEFLDNYQYKIGKESLKNAAFQLHQTTEHLYNTSLLVFTDYKPKNHDLYVLRKKAIAADERFKMVFPLRTEKEKKQFKLLNEAYINSRYKIGWSIDKLVLETLAKQVEKLQQLTNKICTERIEYIGEQ